MSEDVGFSQPYGAILAKIRHLKHDNEMHDNSSEVPQMLTRAKGFLHGHAMKARLILGCGAVKTKIFLANIRVEDAWRKGDYVEI